MISYPDIEKLLATHGDDQPVLSLYLEVPRDPSGLSVSPARAGELLGSAVTGPCAPDGPHAERVLADVRHEVRRLLDGGVRDWLGHCVALFICRPAGLAEAIVLPAGLGEDAVFGPRPHVRPLLVALQRHPVYRVAVINRRHAWLFTVAADRIDAVTEPVAAGVRSAHYGGWYGLDHTGSTRGSPSSLITTSMTSWPSWPGPWATGRSGWCWAATRRPFRSSLPPSLPGCATASPGVLSWIPRPSRPPESGRSPNPSSGIGRRRRSKHWSPVSGRSRPAAAPRPA